MDTGGVGTQRAAGWADNIVAVSTENVFVLRGGRGFGFYIGVSDPEERILRLLVPALERGCEAPVRPACDAGDALLLVPFIDLDAPEGLRRVEVAVHRPGHSPPTVVVTGRNRQANQILRFDATKLLETPFEDEHVKQVLEWAGVLRWQAALRAIGAASGARDLPVPAARILLVTAQDRRKSNEEIARRMGVEVATINAQANDACEWFRDSYWKSPRKSPGRLTRHQVLQALLLDAARLERSKIASPSSSLVPERSPGRE